MINNEAADKGNAKEHYSLNKFIQKMVSEPKKSLSPSDLHAYLSIKGYACLERGVPHFVKKSGNLISLADRRSVLSDAKQDFLNYEKDSIKVFDAFARIPDLKRLKDLADSIDDIEINSSKELGCLYYQNGVAQVTANGIDLIPFENLNHPIWEDTVIKRDLREDLFESEATFERFIWNVAQGNQDWILSIETSIGYLLHEYKDPTQSKAIVLTDAFTGQTRSNGGRGKSLIGEALSFCRKVHRLDGKKKHDSRFYFMSVTPDTNILEFDDIGDDFKLERIFSAITGDMEVESKGKNSFCIPKEYSPKFLISSNFILHPIRGESEHRRMHDVFISDYYSSSHTPFDDFEVPFFTGWDENKWGRFDAYMLRCLQMYLRHGLISFVPNEQVDFLALEVVKDPLLVDYFSSMIDCGDSYVDRKEFVDEFKKVTGSELTSKEITVKMMKFCDHKGWKVDTKKSNGRMKDRIIC